MAGDFFGLQVGMSALYASRRQMEIAAQNVANANTQGYSRQRVNMSTSGVATVAAVHARSEGGMTGVKVDSITRSRDAFLEARALSEHSNLSFLTRSQSILGRIELIFDEPGDTGIQAQLADFWAGWEDVANNPGSLAARSQLIERAGTLTSSINQAAVEMQELWKTSVQQLQTVDVDVNATASRIAELNGAIKRANAAGLNPNELLDQRDGLAMELAERIGGEVRNEELGQVNIFVGGTALVRGEVAEALRVNIPNGSNITNSDQDAYKVGLQWTKDGFGATVQGGEAGGLLDALSRILPFYRASLAGPRAESAVFSGANVIPATFQTNYLAAPQSFQLSVDGGPLTTVTLDTNLAGPPAPTAGQLGVALNSAITDAGLSGVTATVTDNGGTWAVSLTSHTYGTTSSVQVYADGVDPLFGQLFGNPQATSIAGDWMPSAALTIDYSGGGAQTFLVDGVTVTLDTNLTGATAAQFATALNAALVTAGLPDVTAAVQDDGGGNWMISVTGGGTGANAAIDTVAGVGALHSNLFGAAATFTQRGVGDAADGPSLAYQLTQMVNLRHRQGTDLAGDDGDDFFTYSVADGIAMVSRDPNKIAAAAQHQLGLGGDNALDVADISSIANGPDNSFRTAIITLGVEVQTVNRRVDIQDNIAQQVDNARDGESGVSIDEEMANMVQFQHTYAAAARMMTAIDEMLDRLINGTGLVGR